MKILIAKKIGGAAFGTPYERNYAENLRSIAGTWVGVETEHLFADQFNIGKCGTSANGLRVYARDVTEVEDDERPGIYKDLFNGKQYKTADDIPHHHRFGEDNGDAPSATPHHIVQFRSMRKTAAMREHTVTDWDAAERYRKWVQAPDVIEGSKTMQIVLPAEYCGNAIAALAKACDLGAEQIKQAMAAHELGISYSTNNLAFCSKHDAVALADDAEAIDAVTRMNVKKTTTGLVKCWNRHHSRSGARAVNVGIAHRIIRMLTVGASTEIEHFAAVFLDSASRVQGYHVWEGGTKGVQFKAAEVVRRAMTHNATQILVGHNHPSGRMFPSPSDISLTKTLATACGILGITMIDHIIVGAHDDQHYSFAQAGNMPNPDAIYKDTNNPEE